MATKTIFNVFCNRQSSHMKVGFLFRSLLPYHLDRIEELSKTSKFDILAIELEGNSLSRTNRVKVLSICPEGRFDSRLIGKRVYQIVSAIVRHRITHLFVTNYERIDIFFSSTVLSLLGRWVAVMGDSKFEDKPRRLAKEVAKRLAYVPYKAALVSGDSTARYLRFLGFARPVACGFDTISVSRIRNNIRRSSSSAAHFGSRPFLFAGRPIWEKNIPFLLKAYAAYRNGVKTNARELHICGFGWEEAMLLLNLTACPKGVIFHGYVDQLTLARVMHESLALLLPSRQETWGLVINEAVAIGLPVVVSDKIGAKDDLVRSGVNGFIVEHDNEAGWAFFMELLGSNEGMWNSFSSACSRLSAAADVQKFAFGAAELLRDARARTE